ncbi:hypothetical protein [Bacillus bombysepticus]|uniref:hypothetical protein n=1 Tax=Bacillus bombysepticus TaxID=658666 RepID=UPI003015B16D
MFKLYLKRIGKTLLNTFFSLLRIGIIGGGIGVFLIFHYYWFTDSSYGVGNFYRLTTFLLGIPLFIVSFIEVFLWIGRREKRKQTALNELKTNKQA